MRGLSVFWGILVSFAVAASVAVAQDAGELGYGGEAGLVQEEVGGAPPDAGVSGVLPFTGLDLAFLVAAGVALLATGLLLRRFGRSRRA
jgi:hypothetical protein